MVSPKKSAASPPSCNSYLLLAVKILLVVIIILLLPKLVTGASYRSGGSRTNKRLLGKLQEVKLDCSTRLTACSEVLPEESTMCVSHCISPACHDRIYAPNPLEDGEMDVLRAKEFETCVKEEIRLERKRDRSQKQKMS
jgi:hypothetical protein